MLGSLFTGVSGLNANTTAMSVIGDDIANVNTTAFKSNQPLFANILSQSLGGSTGDNEVGRGVYFWAQSPVWSQGSLETTSNSTDMAINGRGFFVLRDTTGKAFYSRAGAFDFDKDGSLVNPDGLIVQGYAINSDGTLGQIGNISIPQGSSPPSATNEITMNLNLNSSAASGDTYSTSITVYDSLGNAIPLTVDFTNSGTGWGWSASVDSSTGTCKSSGTLAFNSSGALDPTSCDPVSTNPTIAITGLSDGASDMSITWNYLDSSGASTNSITGYASNSATSFLSQNGYAAGTLQSTSISADGKFTGSYSNGQQVPLFQLAMADFPSYSGLTKTGGTLYTESINSGQAMLGTPGSGRLGSISSNTLEMSNVDLASEFVKLITTQRAFQANAKVITTSDQILQDLISIKS
jgi:flagellar hook protein FlgE